MIVFLRGEPCRVEIAWRTPYQAESHFEAMATTLASPRLWSRAIVADPLERAPRARILALPAEVVLELEENLPRRPKK